MRFFVGDFAYVPSCECVHRNLKVTLLVFWSCGSARCALGELVRAPAMLAHYKACGPPIKAKYGSMADFIRWKLDFQQASTSLKVSLNDFPYSIPRDGQHYVVWALQPHTDASLAASSEEWQGVLQKGVSGFTGCLEYESDGFAGQPGHAGARIRAFIAGHWPTSKGWQTML